MKIAFVNQPWDSVTPPVQAGSVSICTYEIARRLVKNCDVIIYARKNPGQKAVEFYEKVEYRRVSVATVRFFNGISKLWSKLFLKSSYFASIFYGFSYAVRVAIDLRQQKCDVVHIPNFSQFASIIRAFNPQIKIVLHMHCQWLTQLDYDMIKRRLEQVDLVIGCSEFITEKIRCKFPEFAKKCQTVYNGVDSSFFNQKKSSNSLDKNGVKQLLFVGRVSPEKGVHILLEALEKVVKHFPKVHLNIVGGVSSSCPKEFIIALSDDDPKVADLISFYNTDPVTGKQSSYFEQLQKQMSSELVKHVTFCDSVPHKKLNTYYWNADIFINSSFSEAFPIPIPEAMAASLPVVGSHVGGISEAILNEKTGFLVESGDANELASVLLNILNDDNLRIAMGNAGYQRAVDLFSWDFIVEKLLHHYKSIC
jgi:glycosyltransferase involved in cell wall biosynthesis